MRLTEWLKQNPKADAMVEEAVQALCDFGDYVRGTSIMGMTEAELKDYKHECKRLFRILERQREIAEAMMPSLDMVDRIEGYQDGEALLAKDMNLIGWDFERDFFIDPPSGHMVLLKYRTHGMGASFSRHDGRKVILKETKEGAPA